MTSTSGEPAPPMVDHRGHSHMAGSRALTRRVKRMRLCSGAQGCRGNEDKFRYTRLAGLGHIWRWLAPISGLIRQMAEEVEIRTSI